MRLENTILDIGAFNTNRWTRYMQLLLLSVVSLYAVVYCLYHLVCRDSEPQVSGLPEPILISRDSDNNW